MSQKNRPLGVERSLNDLEREIINEHTAKEKELARKHYESFIKAGRETQTSENLESRVLREYGEEQELIRNSAMDKMDALMAPNPCLWGRNGPFAGLFGQTLGGEVRRYRETSKKTLKNFIEKCPEAAAKFPWDKSIFQIIDNGKMKSKTFRGLLEYRIKNKPFTFVYADDNNSVLKDYSPEDALEIKRLLLQNGAKPKTSKMLFGKKTALAIPANAPFVNWEKWGNTVQDPRGTRGGLRKTRRLRR
jgi:hypothetical protein